MRPFPIDDDTADRLLAGLVAPDDAPPGFSEVARMVLDAHTPADETELVGRERIVAALAAAVAPDPGPPPERAPRRRMLVKLLTAKAAAVAVTTVLAASGAAAATGSLPAPAQELVSDVADVVGISLPLTEQQKAEREARKAEQEAEKNGPARPSSARRTRP